MQVLLTFLDKNAGGHVLPAFEVASSHEVHLAVLRELVKPGRSTWSLAVAVDLDQRPPVAVADRRSHDEWAPTPEEDAALFDTLKAEELAKLPPLSSHY